MFTDTCLTFWSYNKLETLQNSYFEKYPFSEAILRRCSVKTVFLKFSQNSQENTWVSFSIMLQPSCDYCKTFENIFSTEHHQTSSSTFLQNTFFNDIYYIPIINTYFFLLLKFLDAIAKSRRINWRIERIKTWGSIYFLQSYKEKVAGWE